MRNRLLALINFAAIPYVAVRFPREVGRYVRRCFRVLRTGQGNL